MFPNTSQNSPLGIPPINIVYERRSSTYTNPIPGGTSSYPLLYWTVPPTRDHFLLSGIGSDQHLSSYYTWTVDGVVLPVSGAARIGSLEQPFIFPEPIYVSGTVTLYISNFNTNTSGYPRVDSTDPEAEYSYECVMIGRYA
jgi:hypothetical protein